MLTSGFFSRIAQNQAAKILSKVSTKAEVGHSGKGAIRR